MIWNGQLGPSVAKLVEHIDIINTVDIHAQVYENIHISYYITITCSGYFAISNGIRL